MRLSWNEIRTRAAQFAQEWQDAGYEKGQTQLFYRDFFEVFGVPVRRVAAFEEPVKLLGDQRGFIDLFWQGVLLVEQKSVGRDLTKAKAQAFSYFPGLKDVDLPSHLLLSDFQSFELHDLEEGWDTAFALADLPQHVEEFGFILGVQKRTFRDQDPVNIAASERVGHLHDALTASGYTGHDLQQFLVRIVFCFFADDTGIFEPLEKSPHIRHGDALEIDWGEVLPPEECSYVLGNPPFVGQSYQSSTQRRQMAAVINSPSGRAGSLDYVGAWFIKAGEYVQQSTARIGFVATNSIAQGEQVAQLWPTLFDRCKLDIAFAHRTFAWGSDARGMAHVHVVIIGLARRGGAPKEKRLFSYDRPQRRTKREPTRGPVALSIRRGRTGRPAHCSTGDGRAAERPSRSANGD